MTTSRTFLVALFYLVGFVCSAQPVTVVRGGANAKPRQPQLCIDQDGAIFLAYGEGNEIFVVRSEDGQNFASEVRVAQLPKLALGMRRGPRINISKNTVVVTAISHETGNLMAWNSTDAGDSWSQGVVVNSVPRSAREGLHGMASGPEGSVYLVWLDLRSGSTEIYLSKSSNAGASWSENVRVYRSPSGTVCECCHPSVSVGPDGRVVVMWRNLVDGDRDMYLTSSDDGQSFDPPQKLGTGSWPLNACPMDGGDLSIDQDGQVTTVWRRQKTIYVSSADKPYEKPIGQGEQPWIANASDGTWLLWLERRSGGLKCLQPDGKQNLLAAKANDPVIESGQDGAVVVAAWEEQVAGETRIVCQMLGQ
ncbi:sialidase family protein [Roseiconus lacunae]|uniref:sialidase family protein n=1 Tax=Roseiconus lacunae TaxID=2605694 RepID=UPI0011F27129|nr:sialidase family protein [Roseiconus lacunae]